MGCACVLHMSPRAVSHQPNRVGPGEAETSCHARLSRGRPSTWRGDPQPVLQGEAGKTNAPSGRRRAAGVKVARSICPGPRMWKTLSPEAIK